MSDLQTNKKKLPDTIVKRSGKEVSFDKVKVRTAIYNALRATDDVEQGKDINEVTEKLLRAVLRDIKAREDGKLHVEDVQDIIENRLMDFGFNNTARYFIKYRFLHKLNRDKADGTTLIDCNQTIDEYVGFSDWRIKANSNSSYSHASLINNSAGKIIANYWLDKVYSKEVGKAHRNGDIYLHDLDILGPYCCGHDLQQVLNEGFNGVRGRVNSRPPKHFREALGQMANYLGILQSEWAGAQAFSSFDTLLAPYVFRDKLSYKEVKKAIRSFVYNLNVPSRWGQCVPDTYKCLASDGKWKGPDELKQGEFIPTVDLIDGGAEYAQVRAIHKYPAPKVMHEYYGKRLNFRVTPGHRVMYRTQDAHREGKLTESEILLAEGEQVCVPTAYWAPSNGVFRDCITPYTDDPDLLYTLVAMIYRDGRITPGGSLKFYNTKGVGDKLFKETAEALGADYSFDGSSYTIRKDTDKNIEIIDLVISFLHNVQPYYFDAHKAWLVLRVFHLLDGSPKITNDLKNVYYAADEKMLNAIATLGVITGWSVEVDKKNLRVLMGQGGAVEKVKVREVKNEDVEYVWCPTTAHGTFVCMNDEGQVFLTGNCPFTNITLDWTVPNLLKENFPTCGDMHIFSDIESDPELEKEAERRGTDLHLMTYKDFVPEMKMIQRAYFEVMTEGDSTGQPFTFPIPTVNITEEFDWDDENCKYLFENAAKIGSPYFQNFIGSQYKRNPETGELDERDPNAYNPDDLRSMCPLTRDTLVLVRSNGKIEKKAIEDVYIGSKNGESYECFYKGNWVKCSGIKVDDQIVNEIKLEDDKVYRMGDYHLQPVLREGDIVTISAKDIKPGDLIPFSNVSPEYSYEGDLYKEVTEVNRTDELCDMYCLQTDSEPHLFTLADGLITHNCRLQLNKAEIRENIKKRGGGLFGSDSKTGSIGNVTINLARLGYLYKGDEQGLLNRLDELMDLAKESLEAKRKFILEMMERGLYPYTSRYIHSLDTFFSTIGINGANEMIRNFTNDKHDIVDDYGQAMAMRLLTHIRERMEMYKAVTGNLWNLEASPGEACFPRFSEVLTANGPVKIEDLVDADEEILLPSYNVETRKLEYKKMVKAYKSGVAEELVDIVFTNGQTVTCTPNHPIAVRVSNYRSKEDIMWVPAGNLVPGDRVKSNYIRTRGAGHYYSSLDKGVSIHRRIWEFYNGSIPEGYVIHHKDFDKHNNVISNLDMISDAEHRALHLKKAQSEGKNLVHCGEENPFYGKKHKLSTKKGIAEAKALYDKEQLDKFVDAYVNGRMSFAQIGRLYGFNRIAVKQCIRTRQKWGVIKVDNPVCAYAQFNETTVKYLYDIGKSLEETLYIFGGSADTKALVTYTYNKLKFESEDNHTVERVVRYKTNEPVYNLEVEDNHNYFVGGMSSILVHNCCHKFAREDAKRFPDIIQAGTPKNNYYTNSTQLPVSYTNDPFVALEKQDDLQCMYTGGCVEAGNYVVTDRGKILIDELCENKDLYAGVKVVSYNKDTNSSEWDLVTEFHKIDVSEHNKIRVSGLGGLDIVTSDWHPFFVATVDGVVEKRADELSPGDYLVCNKDCMLDNKPRELSSDLAYVIGFYIGDGSMCLTHDNRGGNNIPKYLVRFHHSNKDRLQRVSDILARHNLTKAKPHYCDSRSENLMCIASTSKSLGEFLMRYGFTAGKKATSVRFSEELISNLNEDNAFALLSGLLDTDSYLDPRSDDIEFFTASEQLCLDIIWLASTLGLNVSAAEKKDPRYDHPHYRILFPAKQLYKVEDRLMSTRCPSGVSADKVSHNNEIKSKYNVVRVKSVTKEDVKDNVFYDLTTEKNHNYLCGKKHYVFIHNTVLHMYMGEALSTGDACKSFVKKILTNFRLPYISITPTFSVCPTHGYISGKHTYCPYCDEEIIKEEKHKNCCDHGEA